jgi:hypothetical protein
MWWLMVQTPSGQHAWCLGDPGPEERDDLVTRAKTLLRFPGGDAWAFHPNMGWHCTLSPGEPEPAGNAPHPAAGAAIRDLAELYALDAGRVQAWRDTDLTARAQTRVEEAKAMLAAMSEDEKATLRAHLEGP